MSLEEQIKALTEAVQANTEAIKAAGGSAAAASGKAETTSARGRGRPPKADNKGDENTLTAEQVKAKAVQVKDKLGTPEAKKLINKFAPELAKIKPDDYEAFVAACDKALSGESDDDDGGADDDL